MADDKTEDQTQESEELEQAASNEEPKEVEATEEVKEDEAPAEPEVPEPVADEPTEEPPEEPVVSQRENKRIQELTRKLAESARPRQTSQPQRRQIIDEGDYDLDQVNNLAQQHGDERYNEGLERVNAMSFATDLKIETPRVAQKYPMLDQNSEKFDPGVTANLNEKYLRLVGYNPQTGSVQNTNLGYEEFIDAEIELAQLLGASQTADSTKNLAKQAAQTGVRPGGVAQKSYQGDDPSKMTLEQLQAAALEEAKKVRF